MVYDMIYVIYVFYMLPWYTLKLKLTCLLRLCVFKQPKLDHILWMSPDLQSLSYLPGSHISHAVP